MKEFFNKILHKPEQGQSRSFNWDLFQLIVAGLLAIIAFLVANAWSVSLSGKAELVDVVVATRDISAPSNISQGDIKIAKRRQDSLPKTYIAADKISDLHGVTLIHNVSAEQLITTNEVAGPLDISLGGMKVPQKSQGFMLPSSWLAAPFPDVKQGDRVTIAFSKQGQGIDITATAASGVLVLDTRKNEKNEIVGVLLSTDIKLTEDLIKLKASEVKLAVVVDGTAPESLITPKR